MHVMVTGGAGFIGSYIVEHHLAKGDYVHVIDDLTTGSETNIANFIHHKNFRFDHANILIWDELCKYVALADRIYHMAAVVGIFRVLAEPIQTLAINIAGSERLLRAAAESPNMPRILIASSSEVYGSSQEILKEDRPLVIEPGTNHRRNYAISKLADEALGIAYARKLNMPVTAIRLFNTIGPRQTGRYGMVVPRFVQQAVENKPITIFGDGTQTRSFCDVRDTAALLDLLANNPASIGEIVNVGNDQEISIKNLAALVKDCAKSQSVLEYIPYEDAYSEDFEETQRRRPDLNKLCNLTGYQFQWTLKDTILDLIKHSSR